MTSTSFIHIVKGIGCGLAVAVCIGFASSYLYSYVLRSSTNSAMYGIHGGRLDFAKTRAFGEGEDDVVVEYSPRQPRLSDLKFIQQHAFGSYSRASYPLWPAAAAGVAYCIMYMWWYIGSYRAAIEGARCLICGHSLVDLNRRREQYCRECGCDFSRWSTWRYIFLGEVPLAPGADAEMLKEKRKAKRNVFSLARMRKKQAEQKPTEGNSEE